MGAKVRCLQIISYSRVLVERNSEIDTTVGAVCDRAQSLSFGKMRGHRPRLQKLWYQIHCYAPLVVRATSSFLEAGTEAALTHRRLRARLVQGPSPPRQPRPQRL